MEKKIKWGILGAGSIAGKFAADFTLVKQGELYAVGSRRIDAAQHLAAQYGIPKAYGSYSELLTDAAVDVIYVATTHNFHFEQAMRCLQHNKQVLCEKPVTVNAFQLEQLINEARKRGLFFMEAMWTPFLPAVLKAKQWVDEGKIGEVQLIQANFGQVGNQDPAKRLLNPDLAGGALLDIGIYPLTIIELFAQSELESLDAKATFTETGVDESVVAQLQYKNGVKGQMASHIRAQLLNDAFIYGTKGYIQIPLFWMSKQAVLRVSGATDEVFTDSTQTMGYNWETEAVNSDLLAGRTENATMPLERSLKMMRLMDAIRKQIDLNYPFE
ncbi:MAG: Gfo/Idh/MocA family protein [Salinivirgaceae bacterium]|jgi:predicted dehydrogenase